MTLIPPFEIGVWNVWILLLTYLLINTIPYTLRKYVFRRKTYQMCPHSKSDIDNKGNIIWSIIYLLVIIYSISLPLKLGTAWFYTGISIFVLGSILSMILTVTISSTPTNVPITTGLYRYSRHPIYLLMILRFVGMGIASASWVFLLFSALMLVGLFIGAGAEERETAERYGEAYSEYVKKTPKWIGRPKA